jgi:hypothetical protein
MSGVQSLRGHLDRMTQELTQIKKIAIGLEERDKIVNIEDMVIS